MTLAFRSARDEDQPGVFDLLDQEGFDTAFEPREFQVIIESGRVVGCVRLRPTGPAAFEVSKLAVAPPFRRRGHATFLLERTLARTKGTVTVDAPAGMARFFERLGFAPVAAPAADGAVRMAWKSAPV